jgi:hypothetical protein
MSFHVPPNQTVSFSVYLQTVSREFDHQFIREQLGRIGRAFDAGEPIWMIVEELKLRHRYWKKNYAPVKVWNTLPGLLSSILPMEKRHAPYKSWALEVNSNWGKKTKII